MTEDKIKRGNKLLKELEYLKDQKEKWKNANDFHKLEIRHVEDCGYTDHVSIVDNYFIDFDNMKLLVMAKIDKAIEEVQKEFNEL